MAPLRIFAYFVCLSICVSLSGCISTLRAQQLPGAPRPILASVAADNTPTSALPEAGLKRLIILARTFSVISRASNGANCEFRCWFNNQSGAELSSVTLDCTLFDADQKTIYQAPLTVTSFPDEDTGFSRTCLPWMCGHLKAEATIPEDVATRCAGYWIESHSATAFNDVAHTGVASHWFAYIETQPASAVKDRLKQNKSLATTVDPESGVSAFHFACMKGDVDLVKQFLAAGASPMQATIIGTQPIHIAAAYSASVTEMLLAKGAPLDAPNALGNTPMILAAKHGNPESIDLLAQKGANVNHANEAGERALTYVACQPTAEAARALLKYHP